MMRSPMLYYGGYEEVHHNQPHFLDSCFLCNKSLAHNTDIFMYRGNSPFCSEECRQEQIEIDESKERRWKQSSSSSSSKRASTRNSTQPGKDSRANKAVRTGFVVVA